MSVRTSKSRKVQCVALVFTVLMATSMVALPAAAGAAGAAGTPNDASDGQLALDRLESVSGDGTALSAGPQAPHLDGDRAPSVGDAAVDENVTDADGTVEVIVSVEDVDLPLLSAQETGVVDRLKSQAETSQEPLVEYADATAGVEIRNRFWITNAVLLEIDLGTVDVDELASVDGVERIDKNYAVEAPDPVATDSGAETTYGLDQLNVTDVWSEYDTMGAGAKIAVLDTGVDPTHPDIDIDPDNWAEFDTDGNIVDSNPHDDHYHGTHTSGTVVGGNASGEYIGVAPEATLMHGAVIPGGTGSISQVIAGIEWAVDEDADAVTMSLGVEDYVADFIEVHRNAKAAGTVVIASSGNDGEGSSSSPGNDIDSIAVGATDANADVAYFSSGEVIDTSLAWGEDAPDDWPDEYVVPDVAAPGVDVKSAAPGGGYDELSGTSMAAPHVAGVTALLVGAADETPTPTEITNALEASAWKPAGEPGEQDVRYGHGVVNAKTATDRLAANQGVTGTVTDTDGDPVADATVSLDTGFETTTGPAGEYTIGGTEDVMNVTAEKFGYESASASVTVTEGEFTTHDFTLSETVAVRPTEVPSGAIAGANTTFTFDVANVEALTADLSGDLGADDAALYVDGEPVDVGETHEFDDPDGEVVVDLWVPADASGTTSLELAFDGLGETVVHEFENLSIFEDTYDIGVVDTPDNEFGFALAQDLDELLPINYDVAFVRSDEAVERVDTYDTFVVQRFGNGEPGAWTGNYTLAEDFYEATDDPSTGVVYLDQYGAWSGAIEEVSQATGNPTRADQMWWAHNLSAPLTQTVYQVQDDHPIFDGVAEEGDEVPLYSSIFTGELSWFEEVNGEVIADVGWQGLEPKGEGLAVDTLRDNAYVASMGRTTAYTDGGWSDYSEDADQILKNTIEYVSGDAPTSIARAQPDRVSPGEPITVEFDVEALEELEVDLDDERSTVSEADLTLSVDGEAVDFGSTQSFDEPKTGTVAVTVEPDEPVQGKIALDHTLVDGGERQSGGTGPTAMYDGPIEVPHDVETIQEAVDLAVGDEEIVVDDGTYEEQIEVRDGGMDGLTVRAAEGASPTLVLPDDPVERWAFNLQTDDQTPVVYVRHTDDVTISGLEIDAGGEVGAFVSDTHDVTLSELSVTNASTGIWMDFYSLWTTVEDSTVTESDRGIFSFWSNDFGVIRNNDISDVEVGVATDHVIDEVDVIGNEVTNASYAGYLIDGGDGHVDGNNATNATRGFYLSTSGDVASFDDNTVEGATWGLVEASVNVPDVMTGNAFDAETAVSHSDWAGPPAFHFNDFSDAELIHDTPIHIDSQLNYIGDRTATEAINDGPVSYEPFLTDGPEDVDGWNTSKIGVDVTLEAGDTYTVGVPAPTDQTVGEIVDDEADVTVYTFDAETQSWERLSADDHVEALTPLVVDAETDARLSFSFQTDGASRPGELELEEGWNFVTAPTYGDAESVFGSESFEPKLLRSSFGNGASGSAPGGGPAADASATISPPSLSLEQPTDQIGPAGEVDGQYVFDGDATDAPAVSAFEGYFVLATDDGTLSTSLASNSDAASLYADLGLEVPDAIEGHGPTDGATVEDVLEADTDHELVDDETVHDALVTVIAAEFRTDLETLEDDATATERLEAVRTAADGIVADAPDEHASLVGQATEDAVDQVVRTEFGTNVAYHGVWTYESDDPAASVGTIPIAAAAGT